MSLEMIDKLIEFHKKSKLPHVSLLGGEPTIHKHFPDIVQRVLDSGFPIRIFSGGLIPHKARKFLAGCDPLKIDIIVNLSDVQSCRPGEYDRIINSIEKLSQFCSLSYTISRPDFAYDFLIDVIKKTSCRPTIRISMELPMLTDPDPRLPPSQYRIVGQRIFEFVAAANKSDIVVGFDCGFVLCMFTPEELGQLYLWNTHMAFRCDPIIDIDPDGEIWSCFATTGLHRAHIEEFETRQEMVHYFKTRQGPYRTFGVFEECTDCLYKARGQCGGGCLSFVVKSFEGSGFDNLAGDKAAQANYAPFRIPARRDKNTCKSEANPTSFD